MSDIQTGWNRATGTGDWILAPYRPGLWVDESGAPIVDQDGFCINAIVDSTTTLDFINDLTTAVLISLFSDAAADVDDVIPDGTSNRRGWWGGPIGSKLWLLDRSKATADVANKAKGYIEDALAWLVTDQIATSVEVTAQWVTGTFLAATIIIHRGDSSAISLQFANLWDQL